MERLMQDLRFAVRMLVKSPGFTAAAVVSLGLGIGASATLFSFVNALFLQPLPVRDPESVVAVFTSDFSGPPYGGSSYPDYRDFYEKTDAFSGLAAYTLAPVSLAQGERTDRVFAELVTTNYFTVAGLEAARGRVFRAEEDGVDDAAPVVVLSDSLWRGRFGADPGITGRVLTVNGRPFTVAGVASPGFGGMTRAVAVDLWLPLTAPGALPSQDRFDRRGSRWLFTLGRLKPGVSPAVAQVQLRVLAGQLRSAYPDNWTDVRRQTRAITVVPESEARVFPEVRGPVLGFAALLSVVVGLVLLIACTNVANLLLARATVRRRETAVRLALGASRARLVRQLLTESVMLSLLAGGAGALLALWATEALQSLRLPVPVPVFLAAGLDGRVLLFTLALSVLTGLAFGLIPALQASQPELTPALRGEAAVASGMMGRWSARKVLVVLQTAVCLVLLIGSGLFVQSLRNAHRIDPGFNERDLLLLSLDPRLHGYDESAGRQLYEQLLERTRELPGVRAASLATQLPLGLSSRRRAVRIEGYQPQPGEDMEVHTSSVGPGYFKAMGIALLKGREFTASDGAGASGVAIVNEAFVRRYWPGQDAIGRRIDQSGRGGSGELEVIGLARDGKYGTLGEPPTPFYYIPFLQRYESEATLLVRSSVEPGALAASLRAQLQTLAPGLPIFDVRTMRQHLGLSLLPARIAGVALGLFGGVALVLAVVGIYGVTAYSVSQRTQELGVRVALGAQPVDLLVMVIRQGMALAGTGIAIGVAASLAVTRMLSSLLYGISATDPVTFAGIPVLLTTVALIAGYLPARRATRVDPIVALRCE